MELAGIKSEQVDAIWPLCERFIERALSFGDGEFSPEDIRRACLERDMQLFVVGDGSGVKGAGVTQIINYPRKKYLDLILWAGDGPMDAYFHLFGHVEQWADTLGAVPRLFGRKGWAKKLAGYEPKYTVFVRQP
jgi:hypothetical protein